MATGRMRHPSGCVCRGAGLSTSLLSMLPGCCVLCAHRCPASSCLTLLPARAPDVGTQPATPCTPQHNARYTAQEATREEQGIYIRNGIIVVARNTTIADGTII